ncbi:hypothetical protein ABT340_39510 [Streptosporangium sp. NPDC000239]|uniref:hypothetical protein n=1 Tax=Streptosporangium sp. NPDC000239 TaxID=3154248 RepID=UPI0033225CA0
MSAWIHSDPNADDGYWRDHGMRECARADRCAAPRTETANGRTVYLPALTPRAFCLADHAAIARALDALPALYVRVHQAIDKTFAVAGVGPVVAMSKTAPVPVSLPADELARHILAVLTSWEERVRVVARLAPLSTGASRRRRDGVILTQAWTVLAAHLDALLALPAEPMARTVSLRDAAALPPGTPGLVHHAAGYADVLLTLSGADAGLEILALAARCRSFLTDTPASRRHMSGVPCGACGYTELYEVLDGDGQHAGASCDACRAGYDADAYKALTIDQVTPIRASGARRRALRSASRDDVLSRRA